MAKKLYWRVKVNGKWNWRAVSTYELHKFLHCACPDCGVIFDWITEDMLEEEE
jgi:hypothetical protein